MKQSGKLVLCTIRELSQMIINNVWDENATWSDYDFGIVDANASSESLECLATKISDWHGVKKFDESLFGSDCAVLICDYYGGGCAQMCQIWDDGCERISVIPDVQKMILATLMVQESGATPETCILAERQ